MDKLGLRIRAARRRAKLSQDDLANRLKVSRSTIANWESAITVPRSRRLPTIARTLGVSHRWLLSGQASMFPEKTRDAKPGSIQNNSVDPLEQRMLAAFRIYAPARRLALVTLMEADAPKGQHCIANPPSSQPSPARGGRRQKQMLPHCSTQVCREAARE